MKMLLTLKVTLIVSSVLRQLDPDGKKLLETIELDPLTAVDAPWSPGWKFTRTVVEGAEPVAPGQKVILTVEAE